MDGLTLYIVASYAFVLISCAVGALNRSFDANIAQRISLAGFALWAVWRIDLILDYGYSWPHEPVVVTALVLYAGGTIQKTLTYRRRNG